MDLREAAATSDRLGLMEETLSLLPAEFQAATCTSSQLGIFQVIQEKKTPLHWNTPGFLDKLPSHVCLQLQGTRDMDGELCWPQPKHCATVVMMALWGQDYEKALSMVDSFIVFWPSALWKDFFSFLFFFLRVWEHAVLKCNLKTSHHYIAARKGYSGEKENTPVWSSW